jgi:protein SCO1/2
MKRFTPSMITAALLAAVFLSSCTDPFRAVNSGEDYGEVADFSLTERGDQTVKLSDLRGQVWVAAFIFTRCAGPCAQVSATMAHLQQDLAERPGVKLVSFTVDPLYDNQKVLREYATRFHADPERWLFLTGPRDDLYGLIAKSFHLGVQANTGPEAKPGSEVEHSTRLVLVDAQGHMRGYYDGTNPNDLPRLEQHIDQLLGHYNWMPAFNATLNGLSAVLVALGYVTIRRRQVTWHKACMLSALAVSTLFLASYLYFHLVVRKGEPTRFSGPDPIRTIYLAILLSHTVLAVVVAPLAVFTAYQGLRNRMARHVRVARWTLPLWLYVSVTGVVVYWMLYHLYPAP